MGGWSTPPRTGASSERRWRAPPAAPKPSGEPKRSILRRFHADTASSLVNVSCHLGGTVQGSEWELLIAAEPLVLQPAGWDRRRAPCGGLLALPQDPRSVGTRPDCFPTGWEASR